MKYLLDTCLISELVKKEPDASVIQWLDQQEESTLYLSVLTIGELIKGVNKLPDSARKDELRAWVDHDLALRFEERLLHVDRTVAGIWGEIQGNAERLGKKLPVMDSLIAATALVYNLAVATRNVRDMERCGAKVLNPWESQKLES